MRAEDLGLAEPARTAALALQSRFPTVVFTSGRRGVDDQARAMASNIVHNRQWIAQTYLDAQVLQDWVNANPEATSQGDIAHGLAAIMASWSDAQKARVSKHFSGQAFDVQPVAGTLGDRIKAFIPGLPGVKKFLTTEGGLIRWHVQT